MEYKLIKAIQLGSADFFLVKGLLYFKRDNFVVKIDQSFIPNNIEFEPPFAIAAIQEECIYVRNKKEIIVYKDGQVKNVPLPFSSRLQVKQILGNKIILRIEIDSGWRLLCVDFSGSILWDIESNDSKTYNIINETILCQNNNLLNSCISLVDGKDLWTLDIGKNRFGSFEIDRIFHFENLIVIKTFKNILYCINIFNGSVLWNLEFDSKLFLTCSNDKNLLHLFLYGTYYLIDIRNGKIEKIKSLDSEFDAFNFTKVGHSTPVINEENLIITSSFEPTALVINKISLTIQQKLTLLGNYVPESNAPQIWERRIYILDSSNLLHVFEK